MSTLKRTTHIAEAHHNWKGDDISYFTLHQWVKRRLDKPDACEDCGSAINIQLSNLDGKYTRDLSTWGWKCASCHQKYDRRMNGTALGMKKKCVNGHIYTKKTRKFRKTTGYMYCGECNRLRSKGIQGTHR